jgi:hypothetical protein
MPKPLRIADIHAECLRRRVDQSAAVVSEPDASAQRFGLLGFTQFRFPKYRPSRVHEYVAEQLERVERGEIDRLMIRLPPRHGKSELASRSFPAFCLGRNPGRQFIAASASLDLARSSGRDVRNIVKSDAYRLVYPGVTLEPDSKAAGRWNTGQGGVFYAVGVGGDIMGRGAHMWLMLRLQSP